MTEDGIMFQRFCRTLTASIVSDKSTESARIALPEPATETEQREHAALASEIIEARVELISTFVLPSFWDSDKKAEALAVWKAFSWSFKVQAFLVREPYFLTEVDRKVFAEARRTGVIDTVLNLRRIEREEKRQHVL